MGIEGDYQEIVVYAIAGVPILADRSGSFATDTLFTMVAPDLPRFYVHLRHQVRLLRFEIESTSGKSWHRAFPDFEYVGRQAATNQVFSFNWDATTTNGNKLFTLPDGTYFARISALKANGDSENPAHWEVWASPVFTIDRP
jgi:hypothetical protein